MINTSNTLALLPAVFSQRGRLSCLVIAKRDRPSLLNAQQAQQLAEDGMLFANRCSWAHVLAAAADVCEVDPLTWLDEQEWFAVQGMGNPHILRQPG